MGDTRVFPWAAELDADQLAAFIDDLWGAASGDDDLNTLAAIEKVIADHRPPEPVTPPCPLSERELQILTELASGETKESAGRNLGLSTDGVRARCPQIYARLGARNVAQATAIAVRHGWLPGLRIPEPREKPAPELDTSTGRSRLYHERAAELRKRPGRELTIGPFVSHSGARTAARRIRRGQHPAYRPVGAFAAQAERIDGHWQVVACYLGDHATTDLTERTAS